MSANQSRHPRYRVSKGEALRLIVRHAQKRIWEQIKAVTLIVVYLILFQVMILKIPLLNSAMLAMGYMMVVLGLAFFMEGLLLGLMPLGEVIGIKLPTKSGMATILLIAFIIGVGATFAEPAIGVLRMGGRSVTAWSSPLLFLMLNKYASYLVYAIGAGVGLAMIFGMLRFLYGWSLKPFIYIFVPVLLALSFFAYRDANLFYLLGLAWDCGAITTGPVTVPLILAMGIGISHVAKRGRKNGGEGFGVVTLASLFPIFAVILTGSIINIKVQQPMDVKSFFAPENKANALYLFESEDALKGYALCHSSAENYLPLFDNDVAVLNNYCDKTLADAGFRMRVFGNDAAFERWLLFQERDDLRLKWYGTEEKISQAMAKQHSSGMADFDYFDHFKRHAQNAIQAILPLSAFLILAMFLIVRERLPRADEIFLGIFFALLGMAIFSGGIELGLAKIGDQVGANLPSSYTKIEIPSQQILIPGFKEEMVNTAIDESGKPSPFFFLRQNGDYKRLPFDAKNYDKEKEKYSFVPTKGPLFGKGERSLAGIIVVLLFAFVMGYGATLAEPALNAMGMTVEDITVGTFKKSLLIQAVAVGVGIGIAIGMAKIIWDLPLFWMLVFPYLLLLVFTWLSSEDYVNIGWDSAGVTTGPITVPLVLALGLGVGGQVGVAEGFGILSMASVCPIISVLSVGLFVNYRRKAMLKALGAPPAQAQISEVES